MSRRTLVAVSPFSNCQSPVATRSGAQALTRPPSSCRLSQPPSTQRPARRRSPMDHCCLASPPLGGPVTAAALQLRRSANKPQTVSAASWRRRRWCRRVSAVVDPSPPESDLTGTGGPSPRLVHLAVGNGPGGLTCRNGRETQGGPLLPLSGSVGAHGGGSRW